MKLVGIAHLLIEMGIRPVSRTTLCVAAVAASCAAGLPAPAWADDDTATPSPPATEPAPVTADLATALVDEATRAVEEATEDLAADIAPTTEGGHAVPENGTAEVPEQATDLDGTVPAPVTDSASTDASSADTTADGADTTTDSTARATGSDAGTPTTSPTAGATTPAAAPVAGAINLNVSVRIGSAGDNGPVSQTNATVVPTSAASTTPVASPAGTGTTAPSTGAQTDPTSSPWYWEWNCRDLPTAPVVSPDDSAGESLPTTWTWIWNCEGNSDQYHSETGTQYQQSNTNIAIRISSPGDDGSVAQTNIAISTGGPGSVSLPMIDLPTIVTTPKIELPTITVTTPAIDLTIPAAGTTAIVVAAPFAIPTVLVHPGATVGWALEIVDLAVANEARPAPPTPLETPVPSAVLAGGDEDDAAPGSRPSPPHPTFGPLGAHIGVVTAGSGASPSSSHADARHKPRATRTAPRWTPSKSAPGRQAPASPASGTSASAAGPGGSSGGGLPIFLALPFIAAMLDLARRVAVERATWPSGYRRRVPDTPG